MFCLQSLTHITTDPRFIYLFYFQVLFNQSSIPDFSILDPDFPVNLEVLLIKRFIYLFYFQVLFNQSSIPDFSILDPDFPVNLEVLLIKIILFFSTTEVISCSKIINTFKL